MSSRVQRHAATTMRPRWPYLGRPQVLLLIAALMTVVASFLPWLDTAFGSVSGAAFSQGTIGDGMLTGYVGALALPGVLWRSRRVVAGHLLVLGVVDLTVPGWRLAWAFRTLPGFGDAWLPGPGMLLVMVSGIAALVALAMLTRTAATGRTGPVGNAG